MTSQDFVKRIDLTALTDVTGSQMNQLIDTALPAEDKGLRIITTDSAPDVPVVPDPNTALPELASVVPTHWKRYEWVRMPFATGRVRTYNWNETNTVHATFLYWEETANLDEINQDIHEVQELASAAFSQSTEAATQAETANNNATDALATANAAQTTANEALSKSNQNITDIDAIEAILEDLEQGELPLIVPISRGGSGAGTIAGAVENFGLRRVPRGSFYLREIQNTGVNGGTFTAGTWQKRMFNSVTSDDPTLDGMLTLNADGTITLASGTRWQIDAECTGYKCGFHKARLARSDGLMLLLGSNAQADNSYAITTVSKIIGWIDADTQTIVQIDHRCTVGQVDTGLGIATSIDGQVEVYGVARFTLLGNAL